MTTAEPQSINADAPSGLVASRRGVRVDTETGWSAVVAMDAEDCNRLAASFTAMAANLQARPDVVAEWDKLKELETGDASEDHISEALIRADEREQLAEARRLLPEGGRRKVHTNYPIPPDPRFTYQEVIDWPDGSRWQGPPLDAHPDRRELVASMTRDSIDLGLYDTPASDYPPQEKP